jgi:hypothetical protein
VKALEGLLIQTQSLGCAAIGPASPRQVVHVVLEA